LHCHSEDQQCVAVFWILAGALIVAAADAVAAASNVQSNLWYRSSISFDADGPLDLKVEFNYDEKPNDHLPTT
jgi:hypothetical protein